MFRIETERVELHQASEIQLKRVKEDYEVFMKITETSMIFKNSVLV